MGTFLLISTANKNFSIIGPFHSLPRCELSHKNQNIGATLRLRSVQLIRMKGFELFHLYTRISGHLFIHPVVFSSGTTPGAGLFNSSGHFAFFKLLLHGKLLSGRSDVLRVGEVKLDFP